MITCPWCGTNYVSFQPNCKNCGGLIPYTEKAPVVFNQSQPEEESIVMPPPAPRPISDGYLWRLASSSGSGIVGFVFALLGIIFGFLGFILTIAIVTAFVGVPFLLIGFAFFVGGCAAFYYSYQKAQKIIQVLREGQAVAGKIIGLEQNFNVQINSRYPWIISYQFTVNGKQYVGRVTTLNTPGVGLQMGKTACVLYLQNTPEHNGLYPHP